MVLNWKKYIAECIGTFVLVFIACGTAIISGNVTAIALSFGLSLAIMAYAIGNISGCHINPAVSVAMFLNGKLALNDLIGYVAAQFVGATAASFIHFLMFDDMSLGVCKYGANYVYDNGDAIFGSLVLEIILTFVFVLVVLIVSSKTELSKISGIVCGLALTAVHLFGIGLTGTSVNPARSFGPALFAEGAIGDYWVFLLGPVIGAVIAAFVFNGFFKKSETL